MQSCQVVVVRRGVITPARSDMMLSFLSLESFFYLLWFKAQHTHFCHSVTRPVLVFSSSHQKMHTDTDLTLLSHKLEILRGRSWKDELRWFRLGWLVVDYLLLFAGMRIVDDWCCVIAFLSVISAKEKIIFFLLLSSRRPQTLACYWIAEESFSSPCVGKKKLTRDKWSNSTLTGPFIL